MAKATLTPEQTTVLSGFVSKLKAIDENAFESLMTLGEELSVQQKALHINKGLFLEFFGKENIGGRVVKAMSCNQFYKWVKDSNLSVYNCSKVPVWFVVAVTKKQNGDTPEQSFLDSCLYAAVESNPKERAEMFDDLCNEIGCTEEAQDRAVARKKAAFMSKAGRALYALNAGKTMGRSEEDPADVLGGIMGGKVAIEGVERLLAKLKSAERAVPPIPAAAAATQPPVIAPTATPTEAPAQQPAVSAGVQS